MISMIFHIYQKEKSSKKLMKLNFYEINKFIILALNFQYLNKNYNSILNNLIYYKTILTMKIKVIEM